MLIPQGIASCTVGGRTIVMLTDAIKCRCGVMAIMVINVGGYTTCCSCADKRAPERP